MKQLVFCLMLMMSLGTWAQNSIQATVSGMIFNATVDSVFLSQNFGTYYKNYAGAALDKKGNFKLNVQLPNPDYYYLRIGAENVHVILKNGSDVKIYGDGSKLKEFCNFVGSDESKAMNDFAHIAEKWGAKSDSALTAIKLDPSREKVINDYMTQEYYKFNSELQGFIGANPNSPALILALVNLHAEQDMKLYENVLNQLYSVFKESPSVQSFYANYMQTKQKVDEANFLAPGKMAPDFTELKTDRKKSLKLSDLRGQVVLIDFWASWCGPCRRENPNVVQTYEKYKKDGFTIVSVSLDTDAQKWMNAIEQDQLTWPNHVSDLGGWNSKVAKMYQVSSVPFTVLIDREGHVIKTNLRGPALEEELKRIFGH
ncbi:MAG: TlpA family protein disulfide reductase [Flavobacteriales bacterium]